MNNATLFNYKVAEIEIIYHNKVHPSDMRKVASSHDAFDILKDVWSNQLEHI